MGPGTGASGRKYGGRVSTPTLSVEREDGELVVRWAPAAPGDRLVVGESPDAADGHEADHAGGDAIRRRVAGFAEIDPVVVGA